MNPRPSRVARLRAALIVLACAAVASNAAADFSGQGLVYSTRAGGYAVAADRAGHTYVVEHAPCAEDYGGKWGTWVSKLDSDGRKLLYRAFISCGASGFSIALDAAGNAYVAGTATAELFNPQADAVADFSKGGTTNIVFVVKIDVAGALLYAVKVGGRNNAGAAIAVDAAGSAYVTGAALYDDFPVTAGAYQTTHHGGPDNYGDAFVFKLDPAGTRLVYSTYLGGSGDEEAYAIAVDADGDAYVGGWTQSADFPITPGSLNEAGSTQFVTRLNPAGTGLVYSAKVGADARLTGLAINPAGDAYLTGWTWGDALTTYPGASLTHNAGGFEAYLLKIDPAGVYVVYGTYLGGADYDYGKAVAVDAAGIAYVVGVTPEAGGFPVTPRAVQTSPQGGADAFVVKVGNSGQILYSTRLGGSFGEAPTAIAVDSSGDVYITGFSDSDDFPVTPGTVATAPAVDYKPFLSKFVPRVSLGATALASTVENASLGPSNAIDGDPLTRWSSAFSDDESLLLDLGQRAVIDRIVLNWETAYGDAFEIRVADADVLDEYTGWSTVYTTTGSDGGVDDITGLSVRGRFVRLHGLHRATEWGYSLWEMAVYGTPVDIQNHPPTASINSPADGATFVGPIDLAVTAEARDLDGRVTRVVFLVDGVGVDSDDAAPFTATVTLLPGAHLITVVAIDNQNARSNPASISVLIQSGQTGGNLALGHPALASSIESGALGPEHAVDGTAATRWSSAFSDPQWIYVDLGGRFFVNAVVLNWETAAARDFDVQVSDDTVHWNTVVSAIGGPGLQTLTALNGVGRYVRIYGRTRGTQWGYSLWEFEVYGTPAEGTPNVASGKHAVASSVEYGYYWPENATDAIGTTRWSSVFADDQWIYVDLERIHAIDSIVLRWETAYAAEYLVQVSNDASVWRTIRTVESGGGTDTLQNIGEAARFVRIYGLQRATQWGISLWEFEVHGVPASLTQNLAPTSLGISASSLESDALAPGDAIDTRVDTRWSSAFADDQWVMLDLGATVALRRIVLLWETAYAASYAVQVLGDGGWQTVLVNDAGDGDVDDLSVNANGRYVRVVCNQRATPWGFSLWEIEVYGQ